VLSDTTAPLIAEAERAPCRLAARAPIAVYYRRALNTEKGGNIADWVRRSGRLRDDVVLDADSVMSADALTRLPARWSVMPASA